MNIDKQAEVFRALGEPVRLEILQALGIVGVCTSDITDKLNETRSIPPNLVSYHLQILKRAGIVTNFKSGRKVFYQFNRTVVARSIKEIMEKSYDES